jgi:hypothetical protein
MRRRSLVGLCLSPASLACLSRLPLVSPASLACRSGLPLSPASLACLSGLPLVCLSSRLPLVPSRPVSPRLISSRPVSPSIIPHTLSSFPRVLSSARSDLVFIAIDAKASKVHKKEIEEAKKAMEEVKRMPTKKDKGGDADGKPVLTKKEMAALEKHGDQSKALMLDEFMLAMLQISINKYVATGKVCISV